MRCLIKNERALWNISKYWDSQRTCLSCSQLLTGATRLGSKGFSLTLYIWKDILCRRHSLSLPDRRQGVHLHNSRQRFNHCNVWPWQMPTAGGIRGSRNETSSDRLVNEQWPRFDGFSFIDMWSPFKAQICHFLQLTAQNHDSCDK